MSLDRVKPKIIKLVVLVVSPLKQAAIRSKSKDWLARNQDSQINKFKNKTKKYDLSIYAIR
jgi:hypothetical protein